MPALFSVVTLPATYGLIILGGAALILTQNAFHAGTLGATLAIITVTEPLIGVGVGLTWLHERVATAPLALSVEALTASATIAGVVMLCLRSDRELPRQPQDFPSEVSPSYSEPPIRLP